MKTKKSKRRMITFAGIALLGLAMFLLLQIFMFGRILPGPHEPKLTIHAQQAASRASSSIHSGYYPTVWPSEHADLIRSHAVLAGGLPMRGDKPELQVTSTPLHMPTWGYTRDVHEVFVIGGSPQFMSTFTTSIQNGKSISKLNMALNNVQDMFSRDVPYVAKINTETMEKTEILLDAGSTVNYTGGLLIHANGYIYAVSQSVLYKIDPLDMNILLRAELPKTGNRITDYWTTYNGLQALDNGELVLKGFHLINNAELDGYLLLVNPDTLQIDVKQKERVSSARLMIYDQFLYHVNAEENIRFRITDEGFLLDSSFTAPYRSKTDSSTQASSPMMLPDINMMVFADNTAPGAQTPIRLYSKSIRDMDKGMQTANAFSTAAPGFNFFMVGGDPFLHNIVIYYDPLNNLVSANQVDKDGNITLVWQKENIKASASPAISASNRHVYIDDYRNGKDHFVVLDLLSGEEIQRVELPASLPTVGTIFVGNQNDVFIINSEAGRQTGFVSRITVKPS